MCILPGRLSHLLSYDLSKQLSGPGICWGLYVFIQRPYRAQAAHRVVHGRSELWNLEGCSGKESAGVAERAQPIGHIHPLVHNASFWKAITKES